MCRPGAPEPARGRSAFTGRGRRCPLLWNRPPARSRAGTTGSRCRVRDIDGVHPYTGVLRPPGLLDRAAHVGTREDRSRLPHMLTVPPLWAIPVDVATHCHPV